MPTDSSIPIEQLRSAPEQMEIGGPQTSLYRNFMPGCCEPGGDPLTAPVSITDAYSKPTSLLSPTHLWVLNGDEVWEAAITADAPVAHGGPKWSTGTRADVVARVVDVVGTAYLVRAPNLPVTGVQ